MGQYTATLSTEMGMLGVWDKRFFDLLEVSDDNWDKYLVEQPGQLQLMNEGKMVSWDTGGDGTYFVRVRVNPDNDFDGDEKQLVVLKSLNHKFVVNDECVHVHVGSPEYVFGDIREHVRQGKLIRLSDLEQGLYLVNVYFLYDHIFAEKYEDLSAKELDKVAEKDRSGFIVIFRKVDEGHQFDVKSETPQLG